MRQPPTQPKTLGLTVPQSILVRADVLGRFAEHVAMRLSKVDMLWDMACPLAAWRAAWWG